MLTVKRRLFFTKARSIKIDRQKINEKGKKQRSI